MAKKKTGEKAAKATEKARRAALAEIGARLDPKAKGAKGGQRGAPKAAGGAKAPKPTKGAKPRRPGALDAAVRVLEGAAEPMTCGAIVEKALERKLWETSGKTPSATLYAAIIREIADRGREARFVKAGRGLFALRGGAKGA